MVILRHPHQAKPSRISIPQRGEVIAHVAEGDSVDIDRAVAIARDRFESGVWSDEAPMNRKAVLLRLAELIRENLNELALLDSMDMGKPVEDAATIDVPGSALFFQWYAEAIDKIYDEVAPTGQGDLALVTREPLGVVGAVVPWNFPLDMATWKAAAALAAGNSVVLKPAEQSPLSALRLAQLAVEAGLPEGVFNVVPGYGETAGGHGAASGCRLSGLYRLHTNRQDVSAICRPVKHEAGLARNRRQEPQPCFCRLR